MEIEKLARFCLHKEVVDSYCKKCDLYVCKECQMIQHYEHIGAIQGLDSVFTAAAQEYGQMISSLDKQLIASQPKVHLGVVDEAVSAVVNKIHAGYQEILDAIQALKSQHIGVIKESPFIERLEREKAELESEERKHVESFDAKLSDLMKLLLKAIMSEDFTPVLSFLSTQPKQELAKQAAALEPYYEQQEKFLKHLEVLKSVRPRFEYNKEVVEDLIQVRGIHEEIVKLVVHCAEANCVFVHVPQTRSIVKHQIVDIQLYRKAGQVLAQEDCLIIAGGQIAEGKYAKDTYAFELNTQRLCSKSFMNEERASHSLIGNKDNEVYAVGGYNTSGLLSSTEIYDVNADMWKKLASMNIRRKNLSLCIIAEQFLYAIGGVIENDMETSMIEFLNLNKNTEWLLVEVKGIGASQKMGAAEIDSNTIILFGGKQNGKKCKESYLLNVAEKAVTQISSLEAPASFNNRSDQMITGSYLYVTAGNAIGETHIYNVKTSKWLLMKKEAYLLNY
eukprot:TRINITY_DN14623_c0_g2_i1.p1 TRINITY_DN14623_c0_g2~~TRINITY_DN14623_c0_g2_i1.p1  ORF type:complete len:505 (+),score=80.00 TRINITY_DN14623_c0_g2_i1:129-1643(+)